MKGKINIAVLGLGWWGAKLLRNFSVNPRVSKIYGCDPWAARQEEMAIYPNVVLHEDPKRVLEMPDVDGVVIATPPPTHFELAKAAFAAGKHVLMTKPPTQTLAELEILVEMAEKHRLVFMMDSTFVYCDPVRKIRELLNEGLFGEIGFVQSLRYGNDFRFHHISRLKTTMLDQGTDVIRDLFFHDAAILTYLFPNETFAPVAVHRLFSISKTLCDTAMIRLESQRLPVHVGGDTDNIPLNAQRVPAHVGCDTPMIGLELQRFPVHVGHDTAKLPLERQHFPVHVGLSWTLPERRRELLIADGQQQLIFDDLAPEKKLTLFKIEKQEETALPHGSGEPLANVVDHFLMCIRARQRPLTDGRFMLKVMKLFESALHFKQ